jgi:hypothetical protein
VAGGLGKGTGYTYKPYAAGEGADSAWAGSAWNNAEEEEEEDETVVRPGLATRRLEAFL